MSNDNAPNLSNCGLCGLKSDACKGHTPDEYSMTGNYWTGSFGQGEEFNFDWFLSHYNDRREALRAYVETTLRNGGTILQSFGPTKPTPLGDTLWIPALGDETAVVFADISLCIQSASAL